MSRWLLIKAIKAIDWGGGGRRRGRGAGHDTTDRPRILFHTRLTASALEPRALVLDSSKSVMVLLDILLAVGVPG